MCLIMYAAPARQRPVSESLYVVLMAFASSCVSIDEIQNKASSLKMTENSIKIPHQSQVYMKSAYCAVRTPIEFAACELEFIRMEHAIQQSERLIQILHSKRKLKKKYYSLSSLAGTATTTNKIECSTSNIECISALLHQTQSIEETRLAVGQKGESTTRQKHTVGRDSTADDNRRSHLQSSIG